MFKFQSCWISLKIFGLFILDISKGCCILFVQSLMTSIFLRIYEITGCVGIMQLFLLQLLWLLYNQWLKLCLQNNREAKTFHRILTQFMPKSLSSITFWCEYLFGLLSCAFLFFESMPHSSYIMLKGDSSQSSRLVYPYQNERFAMINRELSEKLVYFYEIYVRKFSKLTNFMNFQLIFALPVPLFIFEFYNVTMENQSISYETIFCAIYVCTSCTE